MSKFKNQKEEIEVTVDKPSVTQPPVNLDQEKIRGYAKAFVDEKINEFLKDGVKTLEGLRPDLKELIFASSILRIHNIVKEFV